MGLSEVAGVFLLEKVQAQRERTLRATKEHPITRKKALETINGMLGGYVREPALGLKTSLLLLPRLFATRVPNR